MFTDNDDAPDNRPIMTVFAPDRLFVTKYFDRLFDRRTDPSPANATAHGLPAFAVTSADGSQCDLEADFAAQCAASGAIPVILRVPHVIGTGMNGLMMTLARGVARGTMLMIRDNTARLSVIHATDIARAAQTIANLHTQQPITVNIAAPAVAVNDIISALGVRIKDKRVGTISPRWARVIYGRNLYGRLTTSDIIDTSDFAAIAGDFTFVNPADYLRTHRYDHESL